MDEEILTYRYYAWSMASDDWPLAIDPPGCGCTECLTGEYVPLDQATVENIVGLLRGDLRNNLNSGTLCSLHVEIAGYSWDIDNHDFFFEPDMRGLLYAHHAGAQVLRHLWRLMAVQFCGLLCNEIGIL